MAITLVNKSYYELRDEHPEWRDCPKLTAVALDSKPAFKAALPHQVVSLPLEFIQEDTPVEQAHVSTAQLVEQFQRSGELLDVRRRLTYMFPDGVNYDDLDFDMPIAKYRYIDKLDVQRSVDALDQWKDHEMRRRLAKAQAFAAKDSPPETLKQTAPRDNVQVPPASSPAPSSP